MCACRCLNRFAWCRNVDFFCGYSPERINPGDRQRRLPDIRGKTTSGSTPEAADAGDALYLRIITACTRAVAAGGRRGGQGDRKYPT